MPPGSQRLRGASGRRLPSVMRAGRHLFGWRLWLLGHKVVFAPLSVRQYRLTTSR